MPLFDPADKFAEPVWNGLLTAGGEIPEPRLFGLLKSHLIHAFDVAPSWVWNDGTAANKFVEFLIVASFQRQKSGNYVSYTEVRSVLRKIDDAARAHAIWVLSNLATSKENWESFGRPFTLKAWPRETRFQTPAVSKQLAFFAERSREQFPDVVEAIGSLLVHADGLDLMIHHASANDGEVPLAARFPGATLDLLDRLISDDPKPVPYELGGVMAAIAEAAPDLRNDQRWRRLRRLSDRG